MTLIVEDGTMVANANTYVNVTEADSYWSLRSTKTGSSTWSSASTANKESALVVATEYIDNVYNFAYKKQSSTQSLQFPRNNNSGVIPVNLKNAVCELAAIGLSSDLYTNVDGKDLVEQNIAGKIVQKWASGGSANKKQVRYVYIESLLKEYMQRSYSLVNI